MKLHLSGILAAILVLTMQVCSAEPSYTVADFDKVRKFDAHVHANVNDRQFVEIAARDGFEILSINVDYPDFPPLQTQADVAHSLQGSDPNRFHYLTTFSMKGFGTSTWTAATIEHIRAEVARGAVGVKVWKNIGMVERDAQRRLIMLDDPRFDGVMAYLEKQHIPLVAHQAEPKNCWLPLEAMTTENDRSYFREHPEYYMYLHPEQPSYESLVAARDRFVARHPELVFIGAHLASLEWSVDELARFLDRYPNTYADLAARMSQVQFQSGTDLAKVRQFFIKYQDRLLYGSDLTQDPPNPHERAQNPPSSGHAFETEADEFWRSDWSYLATAEVQHINSLNADVRGLALPKAVIDKIYYFNVRKVFRRLPPSAP